MGITAQRNCWAGPYTRPADLNATFRHTPPCKSTCHHHMSTSYSLPSPHVNISLLAHHLRRMCSPRDDTSFNTQRSNKRKNTLSYTHFSKFYLLSTFSFQNLAGIIILTLEVSSKIQSLSENFVLDIKKLKFGSFMEEGWPREIQRLIC